MAKDGLGAHSRRCCGFVSASLAASAKKDDSKKIVPSSVSKMKICHHITPQFGPGRWRDMHVGPLFFVAEAEAAEVQLSRLGIARVA